eukprot:SRR837773.12999.p2 GENE.SRR837773.12999~~SRR837773.12999.p2  ORF type:complete len:110 (-),score=21.41 SRR837773.12999:83-412(-)
MPWRRTADETDHRGRVVQLAASEEGDTLGVRREGEGRDDVLLVLLLADTLRLLHDAGGEALQLRLDRGARPPCVAQVPSHDGLHLVVEQVVEDAVGGCNDQVPQCGHES